MLAFSILNVPDLINTHSHKFLKCLHLDPMLNWIAMHESTPLEQRWGCWYFFLCDYLSSVSQDQIHQVMDAKK